MGGICLKRRGQGDFSDLGGVDHPPRRLLSQYHHIAGGCGFPGHQCTEGQWRSDLDRGPHQSTIAHALFLGEGFSLVVGKGQLVFFPNLVAKELLVLRLIP